MKTFATLTLTAAIALALTGCDQKAPAPDATPKAEISSPVVQTGSVTFVHPNGETVVNKFPKKVVVLDFGTLDTLERLGLSDRIVALPAGNVPAYLAKFKAESYANAGGMKEPDIALIAELKPDLIVITGRQGKSYEALSAIAPTVNLGVNSKDYLPSVEQHITQLATLFDKQDQAKGQLTALEQKIATVKSTAAASGKTALVIMHNDGKLSAANNSGYAALIHDLLGVKRADETVATGRQAVDDAYLSAKNPDIIFIVDRSAAIGQPKFDPALLQSDAVKATSAYKNDKIIYLTPDLWYLSGGGLGSLDLQIGEVSAALK